MSSPPLPRIGQQSDIGGRQLVGDPAKPQPANDSP
jgi:hypothetical protein